MKKGTGLFIALVAAAAGAAAAVFAMKKRSELDQYDYDEFDDDYFDDCDCDDCDCDDCDCEDDEDFEANALDIPDDAQAVDTEFELDSVEDEVEDNDLPVNSDF